MKAEPYQPRRKRKKHSRESWLTDGTIFGKMGEDRGGEGRDWGLDTEDTLGILPYTLYSTYFVKITEIYEHAKNGKQPGIESYRDSVRPTRNENTPISSEKYRKNREKNAQRATDKQ